VLSESYFRAKK